MKELIYQDTKHEEKTRAEIETSRRAIQELVDEWNKENLAPLEDFFPLMMNPQKYYGEAAAASVEIPVTHGKFKISRDAYLQILDIPVPNDLYVAARKARQTPYAGHRELWQLREGKTIVVNQDVANGFIFSQNVYAENKAQTIFDLITILYVVFGKYINDVAYNLPGNMLTFGMP